MTPGQSQTVDPAIAQGAALRTLKGLKAALRITSKPNSTSAVASEAPLIADVIAAYAEEHVKHLVSGSHIQYDLEKLTKWWGTKGYRYFCGLMPGLRCPPECRGISRRELAFLNAAIGHWKANHAPMMPTPKIKLPQKPAPSQDFMTRSEAARFLWKARHYIT
jgi:hypothetical protein